MKTEKLNALADEAGFEITPWGNESLPCVHQEGPINVELKKFAQLIVQKCITEIALIGVNNFENEDIMWTVETAIASIKEHFGVEE